MLDIYGTQMVVTLRIIYRLLASVGQRATSDVIKIRFVILRYVVVSNVKSDVPPSMDDEI